MHPRYLGIDRARIDSFARNGNTDTAGEIIRGQGILRLQNLVQGSLRNNFAPARPGPGPKIDDMIGGANRFFIVFHYDHRIAEVAEVAQGPEEPGIIALVQADAGFVQNIENAGQPGTDLGGEPDTLGFAAGKRAALPIEGEVTEPDFDQKTAGAIGSPAPLPRRWFAVAGSTPADRCIGPRLRWSAR